MIKLSYAQLRSIMALVVTCEPVRVRLEDWFSGKLTEISEADLMDMILESEIDTGIIRILTDRDPAELDAFEAIEVIADFFGYIRANSTKLKGWLGSIGLKPESKQPTRRSKNLK